MRSTAPDRFIQYRPARRSSCGTAEPPFCAERTPPLFGKSHMFSAKSPFDSYHCDHDDSVGWCWNDGRVARPRHWLRHRCTPNEFLSTNGLRGDSRANIGSFGRTRVRTRFADRHGFCFPRSAGHPVFELLMKKEGKPLPTVADKERPRVEEEDTPEFLPEICRQHSVSLNKEDGIRGKQGLPYRSEEWDRFHKHARNSIESLNAGIKDAGKEDIEEASRRRVRGFAAAQVFVTILLTNFNLRKIATFLNEERAAEVAANTGEPP